MAEGPSTAREFVDVSEFSDQPSTSSSASTKESRDSSSKSTETKELHVNEMIFITAKEPNHGGMFDIAGHNYSVFQEFSAVQILHSSKCERRKRQ
ncbi:hypothetical protein AVEN_231396-1 [Araneus ventricosus]|uniref:Uncharacterized protein n=1 Tax=Araneus ventricosus TaxID=182803 RepID=A0A4Y2MT94_ARAVE|nr:hypothetical protein AVEN_231396-1 [Araneus ventricosus]